MQRIVFQDKRGVTLVEVMIALIIVLVVFLALMQTALLSIDSNMRNILREEAVNIAEMRLADLRNTPFDAAQLADTGGAYVVEAGIPRSFRNFSVTFTPMRMIDDLNSDNKQVDITIRWDWKENTVANGNPYTHAISTILRRP